MRRCERIDVSRDATPGVPKGLYAPPGRTAREAGLSNGVNLQVVFAGGNPTTAGEPDRGEAAMCTRNGSVNGMSAVELDKRFAASARNKMAEGKKPTRDEAVALRRIESAESFSDRQQLYERFREKYSNRIE